MQRMNLRRRGDRGATAVVVAILLLVLVGVGALAVDLGAVWSDRKQLQNGADAGALAIAQACSKDVNSPDCAYDSPAATTFAQNNKLDANANGQVVDLLKTGSTRYVTVRARHDQPRQLWLAQVLGFDSTSQERTATASWGGIPSSMNTVPIAVSYCQFKWQNDGKTPSGGDPVVVELKSNFNKTDLKQGEDSCLAPGAHNEIGGGFGWIVPNDGCSVVTTQEGWVEAKTGVSIGCDATKLAAIFGGPTEGNVVFLPLFDDYRKNSKTETPATAYHIDGYAAIRVTGYCFDKNDAMWNAPGCNSGHPYFAGNFIAFGTLESLADGGTDQGFNLVTVNLIG